MAKLKNPVLQWPASGNVPAFKCEIPVDTEGLLEVYLVDKCEAYPDGFYVSLNPDNRAISTTKPGTSNAISLVRIRLIPPTYTGTVDDATLEYSGMSIVEYEHPDAVIERLELIPEENVILLEQPPVVDIEESSNGEYLHTRQVDTMKDLEAFTDVDRKRVVWVTEKNAPYMVIYDEWVVADIYSEVPKKLFDRMITPLHVDKERTHEVQSKADLDALGEAYDLYRVFVMNDMDYYRKIDGVWTYVDSLSNKEEQLARMKAEEEERTKRMQADMVDMLARENERRIADGKTPFANDDEYRLARVNGNRVANGYEPFASIEELDATPAKLRVPHDDQYNIIPNPDKKKA